MHYDHNNGHLQDTIATSLSSSTLSILPLCLFFLLLSFKKRVGTRLTRVLLCILKQNTWFWCKRSIKEFLTYITCCWAVFIILLLLFMICLALESSFFSFWTLKIERLSILKSPSLSLHPFSSIERRRLNENECYWNGRGSLQSQYRRKILEETHSSHAILPASSSSSNSFPSFLLVLTPKGLFAWEPRWWWWWTYTKSMLKRKKMGKAFLLSYLSRVSLKSEEKGQDKNPWEGIIIIEEYEKHLFSVLFPGISRICLWFQSLSVSPSSD